MSQPAINDLHRRVLKIGSSLLIDDDRPGHARLDSRCEDVASLRRACLEGLQPAAAAGQVSLTPDDTEVRRRLLNARGTGPTRS